MSGLSPETRAWLNSLGIEPADDALWLEALTHGSYGQGEANYERLEFLGDRVLGLTIAEWLHARSTGPEGTLSQRLNALVSRETCAEVARNIGLPAHIRMGAQARADGGADSDNILGDVMESLLGASFTERGFAETRELVNRIWAEEVDGSRGTRKHPKSALQEWAASKQRPMPEYEIIERSGPDHAASFTVRVSVDRVGSAQATASSKQQAEKLAAQAFMEKYG